MYHLQCNQATMRMIELENDKSQLIGSRLMQMDKSLTLDQVQVHSLSV